MTDLLDCGGPVASAVPNPICHIDDVWDRRRYNHEPDGAPAQLHARDDNLQRTASGFIQKMDLCVLSTINW